MAKILSRHGTRDLPCKFLKKYIILNRQASEGKRELNVQAEVKTKNSKNLKVKVLVDSGCTHTGIDKQLVKDK